MIFKKIGDFYFFMLSTGVLVSTLRKAKAKYGNIINVVRAYDFKDCAKYARIKAFEGMISQINLIKASRKYIIKNKNKLGKYEVDIIFHLIKIAYIYNYYLLWFKNIKPKSSMIFITNDIINFAANINGHKTIFFSMVCLQIISRSVLLI